MQQQYILNMISNIILNMKTNSLLYLEQCPVKGTFTSVRWTVAFFFSDSPLSIHSSTVETKGRCSYPSAGKMKCWCLEFHSLFSKQLYRRETVQDFFISYKHLLEQFLQQRILEFVINLFELLSASYRGRQSRLPRNIYWSNFFNGIFRSPW